MQHVGSEPWPVPHACTHSLTHLSHTHIVHTPVSVGICSVLFLVVSLFLCPLCLGHLVRDSWWGSVSTCTFYVCASFCVWLGLSVWLGGCICSVPAKCLCISMCVCVYVCVCSVCVKWVYEHLCCQQEPATGVVLPDVCWWLPKVTLWTP